MAQRKMVSAENLSGRLKRNKKVWVFFFEHGKILCHQQWSHSPQNAPAEMTSSSPVMICSIVPLVFSWMGTPKYFNPPDTNVVSQGGSWEGDPSSATRKTPPDPMMGCPRMKKAMGYEPLQTAQSFAGLGAHGDTPQGRLGSLWISVPQHTTVHMMMLLFCILKASHAVPNQDLVYLAPTSQQ